jgi:hypothetical protein
MAVGYRAVLRLNATESAVRTAEQQLYSWLVEKRDDTGSAVETADWDGTGRHRLGDAVFLDVIEAESGTDGIRRLYRFTETTPRGTWSVSVYAMDGKRDRGVIVLEAGQEGLDAAAAMAKVGTPRLVGRILDTVEAFDGGTRMYGRPLAVGTHDVDEVVDAICDPARVAPVNVAASYETEIDGRWLEIAQSLTRFSRGVASTFVVASNAVESLNGLLPEAYRIAPGRIRSFLPGVDLENPGDGRRHRILGPATLARSLGARGKVGEGLAKTHAREARKRLLDFELPSDVRRGIDLLHREEALQGLSRRVAERVDAETDADALTLREEEPATPPEAPAPFDEATVQGRHRQAPETESPAPPSEVESALGPLLKRWLGIDAWTVHDLDLLGRLIQERSAEAQVAREELSAVWFELQKAESLLRGGSKRLEELEFSLAEVEEDALNAEGEALKYKREASELRKRLIEEGRYEDTYVEAEQDGDWPPPESVEELIDRITPGGGQHAALQWVEFTGNRAKALEVDTRDSWGRFPKPMWQYVRVLHDFAVLRDKGFGGTVYDYLKREDTQGAKCSMHRHAGTESQATRERQDWSGERVLPVPREVHPDGKVPMNAHFKLNSSDAFAPRLHYYDDTENTGKVYIGYIGRHLTNTKT